MSLVWRVLLSPNYMRRIVVVSALAGAALCLVLFALRISSVFSLGDPVWAMTSGDEQSSLYAIWRAIHGEPVYFNRFQPPFSLASYNWLFYFFYSNTTDAVLSMFGLGDAWLPTVTRGITLAGALLIAMLVYRIAIERWPAPARDAQYLALTIAILVGLGPLVGFWAMTTRADIWALTFETAAVFVFLRYSSRAPWPSMVAMIVLTYLAWSFKQTGILIIVTFGLFLLIRGKWLQGVIFGTSLAALFACTFALHDYAYVENILFLGVPLEYTPMRMIHNLGNFIIKFQPMLFLLAGAVVAFRFSGLRTLLRESDAAVFALTGLVVGFALCLSATNQLGSAENYYFSFSLLAALGGAELLARQPDIAPQRGWLMQGALASGWVLLSVALLIALSGVHGRTNVDDQNAEIHAAKACLDKLPRPVFTISNILSLPWIIPGNGEYFVLSDLYHEDFLVNAPFADNGIAGLIEKGYFASVFTDAYDDREVIYGGSLNQYTRVQDKSCDGFRALVRQ